MCLQTTRRCSTRSDDNGYNPSASRLRARWIDPHHCGNKGNDFEWDKVRVKVKAFMKGNPDVALVLEPHDIDNILDYGVLVWITWALAALADVEIL